MHFDDRSVGFCERNACASNEAVFVRMQRHRNVVGRFCCAALDRGCAKRARYGVECLKSNLLSHPVTNENGDELSFFARSDRFRKRRRLRQLNLYFELRVLLSFFAGLIHWMSPQIWRGRRE